MYVIGTAGHVDHGKSTLVQALTGIHPDRLKEEREREMTIDLGFAWLEDLLAEAPVGVVDVPGHRDFIENMLAGVGGIDAALLVVAADEGVMPQTREHLAILDLLGVEAGLVALTKIDMIDDEDWLLLVEGEVRDVLAGTVLADVPIVPVSARTGAGVDDVKAALREVLRSRSPRSDRGQPRLSVDRAFSVAGFGTVVTGTLLGGSLHVGDSLALLPGDRRVRVRGLQSHNTGYEQIAPGRRVAVNLTGVDARQIARGDMLAYPATVPTSSRMDVQVRLLPDDPLGLKHNADVKVFVNAAEVLGQARVLGVDELLPGDEGWLQLMLNDTIAVSKGDHFIIRRPSPAGTIGGGVVVDPNPARRHKRHNPAVIRRLAMLAQGTPDEILLQSLDTLGAAEVREAVQRSALGEQAAVEALNGLAESGRLVALEQKPIEPTAKTLVISQTGLAALIERAGGLVAGYHAAYPLRPGMPREELKSRLGLDNPKVFNAVMGRAVEAGTVAEHGALVRLPGFAVALDEAQANKVAGLLRAFAVNPYAPPSVKDSVQAVGEDLLALLIDRGDLVQLSGEVLLGRQAFDDMQAGIVAHLQANETITVAEVRDRFGSSRKYALAMLEWLDGQNVTRRDGDVRLLTTAAKRRFGG